VAKELVIILGAGVFLLWVGYLNVVNVRNARKTGKISTSGHELGPLSYARTQSPFRYAVHYWGSVLAAVVCLTLGSGAIGFGIFLAAVGLR
jgi:hypothetical protein